MILARRIQSSITRSYHIKLDENVHRSMQMLVWILLKCDSRRPAGPGSWEAPRFLEYSADYEPSIASVYCAALV